MQLAAGQTFGTDGSLDFGGGVDSLKVTTIQSQRNPNGLARNQLAWLVNGTVRDGGITPRSGYKYLGTIAKPSGLFQGASMYQPDNGNPYLLMSISGRLLQVVPDNVAGFVDLTAKFPGTGMPATQPYFYFEQAELFEVIQAGDFVTLPLFWDGATLRRSVGLGAPAPPSPGTNLTVTLGWVVPPVGNSVVVTLASPYAGVVGDVQTWTGYGTFTVNQISGNTITLVTVSSSVTGITVPPGTYTVGIKSGASPVTFAVTTTNAPGQPLVGQSLNAILTAPYAGNVGDSISWIGVGTYTVLGLTNANQTVSLQLLSAQVPVGNVIAAGPYTWVATPPSTPSTNISEARTTSTAPVQPLLGNTLNVTVTVAFVGTPGDTVYWIGVGVYKLLGLSVGNTVLSLQLVSNQVAVGNVIAAGNYVFVDQPTATSGGSTPVTTFVAEIPAAGPMDYFMGRLWYGQGRQYSGGDIVKGPSGTVPYKFRDSVLKVTENPLVLNGDGFTVPDNAGNLRAIAHSIQINAVLGQGQLYPFSRNAIYSQYVPITRALWIDASANNAPLQTVVQTSSGSVNDRGIVQINGDLYYQTLQPGIASLTLATRYFDQPGNLELSAQENRILQFVDRSLLSFATGCFADNRLLESSLPKQLPQGVVHQAVIPLDFLPISEFGSEFKPAWEGHYEGLQILQMLTGDFGGVERMFMVTVSGVDTKAGPAGSIQLYEQVQDTQFDENPNGESRIQWQFETPAYTWGDEFELKKLVSAEFWVDRLFGEVIFKVEYRPDGETCWQPWHEWEVCSARNTCEDVVNPVCYPIQPYGEGYRQTMALPLPPQTCATQSGRPSNVGFQFQLRVTIRGFCRLRGIQLFAQPVQRSLYGQMVCLAKKFVGLLNRLIG